jgi:hypothetical protein
METTRRHCPICGDEVEMPADTLAGLAAAPELVAEALRSVGPAPAAGWSPAEVVIHLADSEVAFGWRLRQTLAEDEPELQPFDQERWAAATGYARRDPEVSLRAFAAARAANVDVLGLLDDAGWERRFRHPEFGYQTLRTLARHESDHDLLHLRQMRGE